jgi:hypothetical protein
MSAAARPSSVVALPTAAPAKVRQPSRAIMRSAVAQAAASDALAMFPADRWRPPESRAGDDAKAAVTSVYEAGNLYASGPLVILSALLTLLSEAERERVLCYLAVAAQGPREAYALAALYYVDSVFSGMRTDAP